MQRTFTPIWGTVCVHVLEWEVELWAIQFSIAFEKWKMYCSYTMMETHQRIRILCDGRHRGKNVHGGFEIRQVDCWDQKAEYIMSIAALTTLHPCLLVPPPFWALCKQRRSFTSLYFYCLAQSFVPQVYLLDDRSKRWG